MTATAALILTLAATYLVLACVLVRAVAKAAEGRGVRVCGERRVRP
jgi:hypothetical protein